LPAIEQRSLTAARTGSGTVLAVSGDVPGGTEPLMSESPFALLFSERYQDGFHDPHLC
jgi:hypothetical protein